MTSRHIYRKIGKIFYFMFIAISLFNGLWMIKLVNGFLTTSQVFDPMVDSNTVNLTAESASIDLFTQYGPPYGGQGAHQPSDTFGPQQQVELYALVTDNDNPVPQKLVSFQIYHNVYFSPNESETDENGIAHVSFRLPWPCEDPVDEIFGKWYVNATAEVGGQMKNDTLAFWVWWAIEVTSVEPKETEIMQRRTGGDQMNFTVMFHTFSMQSLPVVLTVSVYDELGFFIGAAYLQTTVGWNEYDYMASEEPQDKLYGFNVTIPLPANAVIGKGSVFGNAFDKLPWYGGTPYCPEVTNMIDFYIIK